MTSNYHVEFLYSIECTIRLIDEISQRIFCQITKWIMKTIQKRVNLCQQCLPDKKYQEKILDIRIVQQIQVRV